MLKRKRDDESNVLTQDSTHIDALPQETFVHSLSFLDLKDLSRIARVSKKWYAASQLIESNKCLEICYEYNLLFLTAVKEFIKAHQHEEPHKFVIDDQSIDTCQYGDKTYSELIKKAVSLNKKMKWIFNKYFLEQKEAAFFSEKGLGVYSKLFVVLKRSVSDFIAESQNQRPKDEQQFSQKLKKVIKETAQLLIRWQCYRFRNDENFSIEDAIYSVYGNIAKVNKHIGKFVSIDYFDENSREQHLICLQLQLSDFGSENEVKYSETFEIDDYAEDFNYTDLSGSVGLEHFLVNPTNINNCYFARFTDCKGEKIDIVLLARIADIPDVIDFEFYPTMVKDDLQIQSKDLYKLGQSSLQPELDKQKVKVKELEEHIKGLQQHIVLLEDKIKQSKSEPDNESNMVLSFK